MSDLRFFRGSDTSTLDADTMAPGAQEPISGETRAAMRDDARATFARDSIESRSMTPPATGGEDLGSFHVEDSETESYTGKIAGALVVALLLGGGGLYAYEASTASTSAPVMPRMAANKPLPPAVTPPPAQQATADQAAPSPAPVTTADNGATSDAVPVTSKPLHHAPRIDNTASATPAATADGSMASNVAVATPAVPVTAPEAPAPEAIVPQQQAAIPQPIQPPTQTAAVNNGADNQLATNNISPASAVPPPSSASNAAPVTGVSPASDNTPRPLDAAPAPAPQERVATGSTPVTGVSPAPDGSAVSTPVPAPAAPQSDNSTPSTTPAQ